MAKTQNVEKEKEEVINSSKENIEFNSKENTENLTKMDDLIKIIKDMQSELNGLKEENSALKNQKIVEKETVIYNTPSEEEVTIILNLHGVLDVHLQDIDITMSRFGEERQITKKQFQQLIGKYRKFFDKEYLLIGPENLDYVEKYKIKSYDKNSRSFMHPEDIDKFKYFSEKEIREYYEKLSPNNQNGFLSFWLRKCYEKDPNYYDIGKMNSLNMASSSHTFDGLINELTKTK